MIEYWATLLEIFCIFPIPDQYWLACWGKSIKNHEWDYNLFRAVDLMQYIWIYFMTKCTSTTFQNERLQWISPRYSVFSLENKNVYYTLCKKIPDVSVF